MKNKENTVSIEYFTEMFDGIRLALISAGRQLELCGWCPKVKDNVLDVYFPVCELARKEGVRGCHECIAKHFISELGT